MKLGVAHVTNFGSYRDFTINYSDLGLVLLTGETGAGKSTLLDIPSWILFGVDSKDGAVDEVRTWGVEGLTTGSQDVTLGALTFTVVRTRGSPRDNDLYWMEANSEIKHRGKDMPETQRLLNERLGCDGELYLLAAYLTQFNASHDFFAIKSKERRDMFERLVDMSLPAKIADRASERRKVAKAFLDKLATDAAYHQGQLESEERRVAQTKKAHGDWGRLWGLDIANATKQSCGWTQAQADRIEALQADSTAWESSHAAEMESLVNQVAEIKAKITPDSRLLRELGTSPTCPVCLQSTIPVIDEKRRRNAEYARELEFTKRQLQTLKRKSNPYLDKIEYERSITVNPYTEKLIVLRAQVNPHQVDEVVVKDLKQLVKQDSLTVKRCVDEIAQLTHVYDLSFVMRGELLRQVTARLESQTNKHLEEYFDGELRVRFILADSDKLDIEIRKNGYLTPYKRLSGGQRCMLKLSCSIPRMAAAADRAGQTFELLGFDEAMNGLSPEAKLRAYRLFETLSTEHSSVLLVEHDTMLNTLCAKECKVSLVGDSSSVVFSSSPR